MKSFHADLSQAQFIYKAMQAMTRFDFPHRMRPVLDYELPASHRKGFLSHPYETFKIQAILADLEGGMSISRRGLKEYFPTMIYFKPR